MSLLDYKITDQSVQGVYVQSQPDRLTGTPQQNKAAFDAYPALIRKQFNLLVDALGGTTAAGEIPIQSINGVQAQNVQQALAAIQQNLTAYINKLKATTGAAEVGVSTISGISAGNVQKALEGLRTIQITLDSNIKKLMSANGAATVGVNKISGMQAQNVQKALEELRKAIDDSVSGIIPGGSITLAMLADDVLKYFATATAPESVNIPLEDGFTGALRAQRNQSGEILLTGGVTAVGISLTGNDLIATLPDGYLPENSDERFITVSNRGSESDVSFATVGLISSDGEIRLWKTIPNSYAINPFLVINHKYQARI